MHKHLVVYHCYFDCLTNKAIILLLITNLIEFSDFGDGISEMGFRISEVGF
jgi:hypothetical protein